MFRKQINKFTVGSPTRNNTKHGTKTIMCEHKKHNAKDQNRVCDVNIALGTRVTVNKTNITKREIIGKTKCAQNSLDNTKLRDQYFDISYRIHLCNIPVFLLR